MQVVLAIRRVGLRAWREAQRRQEHRGQNGDDGDDHEQLNEREPRGLSARAGCAIDRRANASPVDAMATWCVGGWARAHSETPGAFADFGLNLHKPATPPCPLLRPPEHGTNRATSGVSRISPLVKSDLETFPCFQKIALAFGHLRKRLGRSADSRGGRLATKDNMMGR